MFPNNQFGHSARQLSDAEIKKLESDNELISEFRQTKLEQECRKNWDLFYKRNSDNFFRDRNWTTREFQELLQIPLGSNEKLSLLEVGCGTGNFIWPLIECGLPMKFYACDFSPRAIDLLRKNEKYNPDICTAFQADITDTNAFHSSVIDRMKFDFISLIFVLSSIHPDKMSIALRNLANVLNDDRGIIIFRDYGLYDHSMLRYSTGHKLQENFYVRQDGTRTYYFSIEFMTKLAESSGLEVIELNYIKRETVNVKENIRVPRIFLQGKFRRRKTND